ncbi:hypothetical protein [Thermorudis peleae]|uniref:hypothetical protein n=1 Tax=Thermorudis peleae TaxID=1382356 RepID=UPI00068DAED1|nr:hypothetical protein [Thermorudis peleae]MBX6755217.1 hypothetical protein [Thermorudis peleae]
MSVEPDRVDEQTQALPEAQAEQAEQPVEKPVARVTFSEEQQREIDRIIAERLERERRKAEKERAEVERRAREKALAENQEWQKLAEERAARLAELEAELARLREADQRLQRYMAVLQRHIDTQMKAAPKLVQEALARLDPLEQLELLTKHADEIRPRTGVPPTPNGGTPQVIPEDERRRRTVSVRELW